MPSGSCWTPTELLTYVRVLSMNTTHLQDHPPPQRNLWERDSDSDSESLTLHSGMIRQIGPLHPVDDGRRARIPLVGPLVVELHIVQRPPDGRGDVPDGRRNERGRGHALLVLVRRRVPFHVVGRQGVGAA